MLCMSQDSDKEPVTGGVERKRGLKKSRFSANISLYLGNDKDKVTIECQ